MLRVSVSFKFWRMQEKTRAYRAHIVSYADDFVILSRGHAGEALAWTRGVMLRLGLTLNEAKTSLKDARKERFDFLGYTFGPHWRRRDGKRYLGYSPSKKSMGRIKDKIGDLLVPGNQGSWDDVRDRLNRLLRAWSGYFSHGTLSMAYRDVEAHVYDRVRNFLRRRHKVATRGTREFSGTRVFGELGVHRLRRPSPAARP